MPTDPALVDQIDAITAYLPLLEQPGAIGKWAGGDRGRDGTITVPYFDYSPEALQFLRALGVNGWLEPYDWNAWLPEAERYYHDPTLLDHADIPTIRNLLTLHVRRDRFHEGHFASMSESGHIAAILRRLATIRTAL